MGVCVPVSYTHLDVYKRQESKQRQLALTLSMGFSYGDGNHEEIGKIALLNLNLAEVRGGDQVVVKENDETKNPVYFGGGTAASIKRTRTRLSLIHISLILVFRP